MSATDVLNSGGQRIADQPSLMSLLLITAHGNNKEQVLCFFPARGDEVDAMMGKLPLNIEVCVDHDIFASRLCPPCEGCGQPDF